MPLHDFECPSGHQYDAVVSWDQERSKCPTCGRLGARVWMSRHSSQRQLRDPIVLHKLPDGTYSFPGRSDTPTPEGAERIEMRSIGDYRREMRKVNQTFREKAARHDEALHERHEAFLTAMRSDLRSFAAQTSDPLIKDLCRHVLESYNSDRPQSSFGEIWNDAMERDASNREAWHRPGETSIMGRK